MPKNVEIAKRFLFWTDTHIGTWVEHKAGKYISKKTHNERAIRCVRNFAEDFKPDVWIHGGDLLDWAPISHWNKERAAEVSRTSLRDDLNKAQEQVIAPMAAIATERVFIIGNHENWLQQFLDKYPCLDDILSLDGLLRLSEQSFKIVEQGYFHQLGKLFFGHGDTIANGQYHAAAATRDYMRNIVYGHRHTFQAHSRKKPLDKNETLIGWSIPGLCDLNPHYSKRQNNEWSHGFAYGYLLTDGTFSIYPVIMHAERFALNGKVYTP
jgi:metallophosphoesterase superfamily enzyme